MTDTGRCAGTGCLNGDGQIPCRSMPLHAKWSDHRRQHADSAGSFNRPCAGAK
ncbi:hypothetical protein [Azospirillum largimobile]